MLQMDHQVWPERKSRRSSWMGDRSAQLVTTGRAGRPGNFRDGIPTPHSDRTDRSSCPVPILVEDPCPTQ